MDYKNTLNLPRTDFPMKADLVAREPQRLQKWEQSKLYERIQASRASAEKFVLHDGPPFANGDVHIGTALNKILKDIIIKYKSIRGFNAPYIPGWDCHGLPIEFKVSQEMRKAGDASADAATIRKACDAYARKFIDIQRTQFKRLGVLGDWENPYLTLNKEYEADELRLFADIVEKGFVYRGKKPVYWSIPARTALAEAEVEYNEHTSTSIYVKCQIVGEPNTFFVIWTTTPWTLPANLAIAYNSTFNYSQVFVNGESYIVSTMLLSSVAEKCGWGGYQIVRSIDGEQLAGMEYHHPFCNRTGKLYAGDSFVENSTGTGFVHCAPGHGLEDYNLGRQVGLPIYSPVNDDGKLATTNDLPLEQQFGAELIGKSILEKGDGKSEANEAVLNILRDRQRLVHAESYQHSYPFCWRSKTPVIFRAMDQWFIRIDHALDSWTADLKTNCDLPEEREGGGPHSSVLLAMAEKRLLQKNRNGDYEGTLRWKALDSIETLIDWVPEWGRNRIKSAVETRPDWCISRQRSWGVPIPAFYGAKDLTILYPVIIRKFADLVEQHGSNLWFEKSTEELARLLDLDKHTSEIPVRKSMDTLDVWIDSGSSSRAVIARRAEIRGKDKPFQADMYLEGSDQHRGWFQSSLLLSLAGNGAAPYRAVLTHGFMVDEDREKISKSKQGQGVYLKPQTAEQYIKDFGADVIRLWVASQDYRNDIIVSEERLKKVSESYRVIRNALRYQLSNLYDFHPSHNAVADKDLTGLDRWILNEFAKLERDVLAAYDRYEFHVVYQRISQFAAVELSAQYHDLVKDRLYTDPANSLRRRSTQTALHQLVVGLSRLLAPVLAFTADEAWEFVPGAEHESVHEETLAASRFALGEAEGNLWKEIFALRDSALPLLELERKEKRIGKSLEAALELHLPESCKKRDQLALEREDPVVCEAPNGYAKEYFQINPSFTISPWKEQLKEVLGVSALEIVFEQNTKRFWFVVKNAPGRKCERCWHWETDVGQHTEHPTICGRCVEAVKQVAANAPA